MGKVYKLRKEMREIVYSMTKIKVIYKQANPASSIRLYFITAERKPQAFPIATAIRDQQNRQHAMRGLQE